MNEYVVLVLTYLIASIPFGLIVGKVWGAVDVRKVGSGNIGTSNVMRSVGKGAAALVLVLDVLKGGIPVWFALSQGYAPGMVSAVAVLSVFAHVYSVFLRFNGGKGIATTFGVMLALDGGVALSLVIVWGAVLFFSRYISLASLVAALWLPIALWVSTSTPTYVIAGCVISAIAIWRHRSNLQRLRAGTEYRLGERVERVERG